MPTAVQFYQLKSTPPERALPKLVAKAYGGGYRVHLVLGSEERVQQMNEALWTFEQLSFLPHGTARDGNGEKQPVFLSTSLEAPNHPTLLFIADGRQAAEPEKYQRVLDLFDGNDEASLTAARARWKAYKDQGCEMSYFKQDEKGGWEKLSAAA